jgi:hypothetical protein
MGGLLSLTLGMSLILPHALPGSDGSPQHATIAEGAPVSQQDDQKRPKSSAPRKRLATQEQTNSEPVVQAELQPSKRRAVPWSPTRIESENPGQIEPEFKTRRPSRKRRTTEEAGSKHSIDRVVEISAPAAKTFDPITQTDIELSHDPQIAVGENFIVATQSTEVAFYDKQGNLLKEKPDFFGGALPTKMSATDLFDPVLNPFLRAPDGTIDPSQKNPNDINRHLGKQTGPRYLICTPDNPVEIGCINVAYDTRVTYDRERKRFWIVSALRDRVWGKNDPNCGKVVCASMDSKIPRRFVGVAVTLSEDPRDGFHEFVLLDEYADWPRFALHGPFLIISHNSNTKVHLFDAQKLTDGNFQHELVWRGTFSESDFNSDHIYPVVQHDRADETEPNQSPFIPSRPLDSNVSKKVPTFLVGIAGDEITIFAFDPASTNPLLSLISPPKLAKAIVPIADGSFTVRVNPVYRNGFIYIVGDHCAEGSGRTCNHEIRFLKIPVFRGSGPVESNIFASPLENLGFIDKTFGGLGHDAPSSLAGPSFEIPGVEVNKNDDVVIVYERAGPGANVFLDAPGAFYRHVKKDGTAKDGILHLAHCGASAEEKLRCAPRQPDQSIMDTAGIAIDPSDDATIWMAHAIGDSQSSTRFRMVIGHIKPE